MSDPGDFYRRKAEEASAAWDRLQAAKARLEEAEANRADSETLGQLYRLVRKLEREHELAAYTGD